MPERRAKTGEETSLAEYRRKRRDGRTPEPFDGGQPSDRLRFVVQRHSARRLHYDFRLERDGVLLSWAIPKGLPTEVGSRRLAVQTEDHPLAYLDFEGLIPAGQYGAGTMDIYDRGAYELVEQKRDGGLTVRLDGTHLRGLWTLVPADLGGEARNWLLIRKSDGAEPASKPERAPATHSPYEPMLATPTTTLPIGAGWLYEVKWDGYRAIGRLVDGDASLWSRRGLDLGDRFAAVVADLGRGLRSPSCVVDGEVCALDGDGRPSFSLLQNGTGHLVYYVFDVLELEDEELCQLPLSERRRILADLIDETSRTVRLSKAFEDGPALLAAAREQRLEGVLAKRAASTYAAGRRSREWMKVKLRTAADLVIVGYATGIGSRSRLGALVVAQETGDGLVYAGRVGTGFTEAEIDRLLALLEPLRRDDPPLATVPRMPGIRRGQVSWVEPRLACEVEFTEWTSGGHVRNPVYRGLRDRESAPSAPIADRVPQKNLGKVFFPRDGITKGDLLDYYQVVAPVLVPHLRGRPFTMKRYPDGIDGSHFFQKDAPTHMPDWIGRVELDVGTRQGRTAKRTRVSFAVVDSPDALMWMVAMGCIDLHVTYSHAAEPDCPDYVLFDLDPTPGVPFADTVRVALMVKEVVEAVGLRGYPKTSGSDGIHVCVPIEATAPFAEARLFAQVVAETLERGHPGLVTTRWEKARRTGVLIDWKQNGNGATIACVYSVRPHDGAPVSCPLDWSEVDEHLDPARFTMAEVRRRIEREGDLFAPVLAGGPRLVDVLARLSPDRHDSF